ncbi:MAG: nucleoside triphosphate pyrophosphohydrolase [Rickettsiales bacterium]|nr:nucleoside triphosphate pyrophosphohydrolase [Pseudomonadota bacterium]MDA0966160.1 nucleoside triphosphate pyrophosphohydrolase [Pseudomonadota bacterium]MDG4543175.1 nucleoside triphosphate pyrophosphohydrolase [Rickettsiales bacterium]MDG4545373.1 nucleoside triphosphate pyrophosphohydrolase [Rickettsiales bacterium]MDG4547822.1 nucleoside triphosphate pyrophosphohydrolase [Rickettsiales bacterium]
MNNVERLKEIMSLLRDPEKGCPWDVEQDFKSISPHTIEEAYEVVDAIDKGDMQALKEELGDLLLQVIFHSQMASEQGSFNFDDVVDSIINKLVERHPHVFGDADIKTAQEQEKAWEEQKAQERAAKAKDGDVVSVLDGVAIALPALTRSVKLQKRAAKVGFDWADLEGVYNKIDEEYDELKRAVAGDGNIEEEFGDLLFCVSNLGRKLKIDPEVCLKGCNEKFIRRFKHIENSLAKQNRSLEESDLEEMDRLWNEAKAS